MVGSTTSRLEINFKIYDYEEQDDDFYLGSYKHFIEWNHDKLRQHQQGSNKPKEFEKELNNHGKGGSFRFRIYTGTLQYYIKWGRPKMAGAQRKKKSIATAADTPPNTAPDAERHYD